MLGGCQTAENASPGSRHCFQRLIVLQRGQIYELDHVVTLIGYDQVKGYLIRNNWGDSWGQHGLAYVDASAGVCNFAIYPILMSENWAPTDISL